MIAHPMSFPNASTVCEILGVKLQFHSSTISLSLRWFSYKASSFT